MYRQRWESQEFNFHTYLAVSKIGPTTKKIQYERGDHNRSLKSIATAPQGEASYGMAFATVTPLHHKEETTVVSLMNLNLVQLVIVYLSLPFNLILDPDAGPQQSTRLEEPHIT